MPVVSAGDIHNMNRDPISEPYLLLVELEEHNSGILNRWCVNNEPVVSNGNTYEPAAIEFSIPASGEEQTGVKAVVSNVDRTVGKALLAARKRVSVRLMVINIVVFDDYLIDTLDMFFISEAQFDAQELDATISSVIDWFTPVPFEKTTENLFPGVWA